MGKENLTVKQTAHERKMVWMEQAIQEGALFKLPLHTSQEGWEKQQDIGITYTFGDAIYEDLARIHGLTKERIRQLNKKFVKNLSKNSSPALQVQYPLGEIPFAKPLGQKSRERFSEFHGGTSLRIKKAIEELDITVVRVEDIGNIVNTAQVTRQQFLTSIQVLENWGIYIHRINHSYQDFAVKIEKENDYAKLQEILDSLAPRSLRAYIDYHRKDEQKALTDLSSVVRDKGFHFHNNNLKTFAEKVREKKFPILELKVERKTRKKGKTIVTYYVVPAKCGEAIGEALRNDPDLQRFR